MATDAERQFPYTSTQGLQSPTPGAPPPRRFRGRLRWAPLLVGGAAGLVGLAILTVSLVYGRTMNPIAPAPGADAPPASSVVQRYLDALAAGDASSALALAAAIPADQTFLTSRVLTSGPARITGVEVPEGSNQPASQSITARYLIGQRPVTATFAVFRNDNQWRLGSIAAEVPLPRFGDLKLLVNGLPVAGGTVALFPGQYTLGVDDPRYRLDDADFLVEGPASVPKPAARLALSSTATEEIGRAARAHLTKCLAAVDFDPPRCGFRIAPPQGTKLDESTVEWSLVSGGGTLDSLAPELDRVGSAVAPADLVVRADVQGRDGSRWRATAHITRVYAELTGDQVSVEFG